MPILFHRCCFFLFWGGGGFWRCSRKVRKWKVKGLFVALRGRRTKKKQKTTKHTQKRVDFFWVRRGEVNASLETSFSPGRMGSLQLQRLSENAAAKWKDLKNIIRPDSIPNSTPKNIPSRFDSQFNTQGQITNQICSFLMQPQSIWGLGFSVERFEGDRLFFLWSILLGCPQIPR